MKGNLTFRKAIFWGHLAAGTVAGLVIAVMAVTGTLMAFRGQITLWAEQDVRTVTVGGSAERVGMKNLLEAVREARPEGRANQVTLSSDPAAAVVVSMGRNDLLFVNPYTGEIKPGDHARLGAFFDTVEGLHRWLGLTGSAKSMGTAVTSACCALYFLLLLSGLYLWWPKGLGLNSVAAALRPRFDRRGRARDWNWHTTLGFWISPLLLLTTSTGLIMAYPSLADRLYKRPSPEQPAAARPSSAQTPAKVRPLSMDAMIARVQEAYPNWETIGVRLGMRRAAEGGARAPDAAQPASQRDSARGTQGVRPPVNFTVRNKGAWPAWLIQVSVDPYTGDCTVTEDPSHEPFLRVLRTSARSFHTGEALGTFGGALVAISAMGSLALVATGLSLAVRRFAGWVSRPKSLPGA